MSPFFAAVLQKGAGVLEVATGHIFAQNALRGNGCAVGSDDQTNLPGGDDDDGLFDDAEHPGEVAEVPARGEGVRLVAGFPIQGDELACRQTTAKFTNDDADFVFFDDDQTDDLFHEDERGE